MEAPKIPHSTFAPVWRRRAARESINGPASAGGAGKAGPAAFAAIGVERELGDQEDVPADVEERAVEAALLVGKYAQFDNLAGDPVHLGRAIAHAGGCKDEQSAPGAADDFPFY